MRGTLGALVLALACSFASSPTRAHDAPFGNGVFVAGDTILLRSNRGLFLSHDGTSFSLLCNEALGISTSEVPPILRRDADWLVGTSHALLAASDDLCTLEPIAPLDAVAVTALVRDPATPRVIYASTGQSGFDNGLYASDDDGATFTPLGATDPNRIYQQLAWSPPEATTLFASGLRVVPGASDFTWFLATSHDRGTSFAEHTFVLGSMEYELALLSAHPERAATLFAVARAELGTGEPDRLLVSDDEGASFRSALELDRLGGMQVIDGKLLWVAGRGGLWRSKDDGATFEQLSSAPTDCVQRIGSRLYLCDTQDGVAGLSVSDDDGVTRENVMRFTGVSRQVACAFDSQVAIACAAAWGDFQRELRIGFAQDAGVMPATDGGMPQASDASAASDASHDPPQAEDSGCSCTTPGAHDAHASLEALSLACCVLCARSVRRRQRRASAQATSAACTTRSR